MSWVRQAAATPRNVVLFTEGSARQREEDVLQAWCLRRHGRDRAGGGGGGDHGRSGVVAAQAGPKLVIAGDDIEHVGAFPQCVGDRRSVAVAAEDDGEATGAVAEFGGRSAG